MRPAVIAETRPEPAPDPTPAIPPKTVIAFASGSALDDAGRAALDALLAMPALGDDMLFVLSGHSDPQGSDRENLATSRKRAEAVAAYLSEKGVAKERITIIALGERRPIAPSAHPDGSDYPEGRARNRRVEVVVVRPAPAVPDAPEDVDSVPASTS
ncbi:OmpA family protein [Sphingomonas gilva]|uniref:OmpA family protein n=2 Tax=Sphingomonas gilva TaxID=2305907 RepID=A0A396RVG9_9SPHN|nr:OmpA family protein [Sphingomonas gilva]